MTDTTNPTPGASISLTQLFSLALQTIQAVEQVYPKDLPGNNRGKEKFESTYATVMAFAPLASVGVQVLETVLPLFINTAVGFFNKLGIFHKAADAPPAP